MDISITNFKQHCLAIVRRVERTGATVTITRNGRMVAQLHPAGASGRLAQSKPWEQLRKLGGRLEASAEESVLQDGDFEALR